MMERLLDKAYKWMESFLLLVALALMLTACKSQPPMRLDAVQTSRRIRRPTRRYRTADISIRRR